MKNPWYVIQPNLLIFGDRYLMNFMLGLWADTAISSFLYTILVVLFLFLKNPFLYTIPVVMFFYYTSPTPPSLPPDHKIPSPILLPDMN
jgi:hypothetical protein